MNERATRSKVSPLELVIGRCAVVIIVGAAVVGIIAIPYGLLLTVLTGAQ